jgi:hypothetical protein
VRLKTIGSSIVFCTFSFEEGYTNSGKVGLFGNFDSQRRQQGKALIQASLRVNSRVPVELFVGVGALLSGNLSNDVGDKSQVLGLSLRATGGPIASNKVSSSQVSQRRALAQKNGVLW